MKISACVIVKNEEKNITQWLNNMRQIADEIIVVDTGSTDNTLTILENSGVTPYHFIWCNDFSAAKNYAIQRLQETGLSFWMLTNILMHQVYSDLERK